MLYNDIIEIEELAIQDLNKAMYEEENRQRIIAVLFSGNSDSAWYDCAKDIFMAVHYLMLGKDEAIKKLKVACESVIKVRQRFGEELVNRAGHDIPILEKFIKAKTKKELEEFRIPGIVYILFRLHVSCALKSLGICQSYLKSFDSEWEAWIRLIFNDSVMSYEHRYLYMYDTAYGNGFNEKSMYTGKSPARISGLWVKLSSVNVGAVIETQSGIRYYVTDKETTDEAVKVYLIIDPREGTTDDGFRLSIDVNVNNKKGWIVASGDYTSDVWCMLIGYKQEPAMMNERIVKNDIRKGDIVSIYGVRYVMGCEITASNCYCFEDNHGGSILAPKDTIEYDDNVVVVSNIKVAPKVADSSIVFKNGFTEICHGDEVVFKADMFTDEHRAHVVFNTTYGAYGVLFNDCFIPLSMLYSVRKFK